MKADRIPMRKRSRRILLFFILLPVLVFSIVLGLVYAKQGDIIQDQVDALNLDHQGLIEIGETHLTPFKDFPFISLRIDSVRVMETKAAASPVIMDVADIYIGFNLWDIVRGNYDIQSLVLEEGFCQFVFHEDGSNNIKNALASADEADDEEALKIHLKKIKLINIDLHKLSEATNTDIETYVYSAEGGFKTGNGIIQTHVNAEFELNVIQDGDTTYINRKDFEFNTDLTFDESNGMLSFQPSRITMEHAGFTMEGTVDTKKDVTFDLVIKGTQPSFDMLMAFAPHDLIPVLERYDNAGKIYFNTVIQGPTTEGRSPYFDAQFGASEAFLENVIKGKRVDDMGFQGHFTNGKERHLRSMEFSLTEMTARLEKGNILGAVRVKNFEEPDVDVQVKADFDLEFLAGFFELEDIETTSGKVLIDLRFHDIIDLDHPEIALRDLNQAYFMELLIQDLSVASDMLPAPLDDLDVHLTMNGKQAELDRFDLKMGESDLSIRGYLSDFPAVVHHTDIPVTAHLELEADMLDLAELSRYSESDSTGVDEQIEDFKMGFSFMSTAKNFTESKYLPEGEFFIDNLHAQLKHYPHELHDFHADILIDDVDLKVVDFTGHIDDSDFHLDGLIHDYGFWFQPELNGDVDLDLTLKSDLFRLEDIFAYKGENHVPEDYRHEEFDNLILHANTSMHYKDSQLHSLDIDLDRLNAKMHLHPMRFEDFHGRVHYEDEHVLIENLHGKMGRTVFDLDMDYYLGKDEAIRKRDNHLGMKANYIDYDQLFSFNPSPAVADTSADSMEDVAEHAQAFNIYELPFTDMSVDLDIDHFIYHHIELQNIHARLRTTKAHYLYVDTIRLKAAGGKFNMSGYFNGSDPKHIYLKPDLSVEGADIDKLLFKFESFGHDIELVENLHGKLSADIHGNIRIYPDLVPDLDQSEVHLDVEVLKGRLVNYEPMLLLSEYMGDKDLTDIRFDTLSNHMDLTNGLLSIPNMNIESTLGHYEISGRHDLEHNIEYYLRIPWKTVRQSAKNRLFGGKKNDEDLDDEIVEVDQEKKVRYLNLKIHGTLEDYKIKLGKKAR